MPTPSDLYFPRLRLGKYTSLGVAPPSGKKSFNFSLEYITNFLSKQTNKTNTNSTQLKKAQNLQISKKKKPPFFLYQSSGLPAGSGVLASQGDQPKKGGIFFFFSMILICVVCSINADATLRYAPLRTLSGQKKFSTSAKMSRQTVKTAALTRILHIISRSPPLRNKKKYVRSVACRRFLV